MPLVYAMRKFNSRVVPRFVLCKEVYRYASMRTTFLGYPDFLIDHQLGVALNYGKVLS